MLSRLWRKLCGGRPARKRPNARLVLESLEDRAVPNATPCGHWGSQERAYDSSDSREWDQSSDHQNCDDNSNGTDSVSSGCSHSSGCHHKEEQCDDNSTCSSMASESCSS